MYSDKRSKVAINGQLLELEPSRLSRSNRRKRNCSWLLLTQIFFILYFLINH